LKAETKVPNFGSGRKEGREILILIDFGPDKLSSQKTEKDCRLFLFVHFHAKIRYFAISGHFFKISPDDQTAFLADFLESPGIYHFSFSFERALVLR